VAAVELAYEAAAKLSRTIYFSEVYELRNDFSSIVASYSERAAKSVKSMAPSKPPTNTDLKHLLKKSVVFIDEIADSARPRPRTSIRMSRNANNRETIKISNSRVNVSPINRMSGITVIEENMKGLFTVSGAKERASQNGNQSVESLALFVAFTEIL